MYPFDKHSSRITLTDTGLSACQKMSDGNPGALSVMMQMMTHGGAIDPDSLLGGFGVILSLDTHRIYGSRIWMLYKDVCEQDLRVTLAILRACQLGFLSDAALQHAIDSYGDGLDIPSLVAQVETRLPAFQRAKPAPVPEPELVPEPMMSHVDYLNSQATDNDVTDDLAVGAAVAEIVSDVVSEIISSDTPSSDSDFGGFDGGDSGGGGASGDY